MEGSDAPDCYVIAAGEAEVFIGGERVAVVGADDVVGERGLILGRSARRDGHGDVAHDHVRDLARAPATGARRLPRRDRGDARRGPPPVRLTSGDNRAGGGPNFGFRVPARAPKNNR